MTGRECPATDCYRLIALDKPACATHWARVDPHTKAALAAAYRCGDLTAHASAMTVALAEMTLRRKGRTQ